MIALIMLAITYGLQVGFSFFLVSSFISLTLIAHCF